MTSRSTTCLRCSRRAGLTLIEVIAAIVILGTILVGVVLARARHTRQIRLSQRKAQAVRAADALLTEWWTRPEGIPVDQSGLAGPDDAFQWQTRLRGNREVEQIGGQVLQLVLRDADPGSASASEGPLVRVELVLPGQRPGPDQRGDDPNQPTAQGGSP